MAKKKKPKRKGQGIAAKLIHELATKVSKGTSSKALNDNEHKKRKKELRQKPAVETD